ncbi:hypothetical protein LTR74_003353 [Friedmanniomyces endolithicus]|nr:hypothetical protein LTR74_003353 [Friedmanniomyces endolithicus]
MDLHIQPRPQPRPSKRCHFAPEDHQLAAANPDPDMPSNTLADLTQDDVVDLTEDNEPEKRENADGVLVYVRTGRAVSKCRYLPVADVTLTDKQNQPRRETLGIRLSQRLGEPVVLKWDFIGLDRDNLIDGAEFLKWVPADNTNVHDVDLSSFGPLYIFGTHLTSEQYDQLCDWVRKGNGSVTRDTRTARVVFTNATKTKRILYDFRTQLQRDGVVDEVRPVDDSLADPVLSVDDENIFRVYKIDCLEDSFRSGTTMDLSRCFFQCRLLPKPQPSTGPAALPLVTSASSHTAPIIPFLGTKRTRRLREEHAAAISRRQRRQASSRTLRIIEKAKDTDDEPQTSDDTDGLEDSAHVWLTGGQVAVEEDQSLLDQFCVYLLTAAVHMDVSESESDTNATHSRLRRLLDEPPPPRHALQHPSSAQRSATAGSKAGQGHRLPPTAPN